MTLTEGEQTYREAEMPGDSLGIKIVFGNHPTELSAGPTWDDNVTRKFEAMEPKPHIIAADGLMSDSEVLIPQWMLPEDYLKLDDVRASQVEAVAADMSMSMEVLKEVLPEVDQFHAEFVEKYGAEGNMNIFAIEWLQSKFKDVEINERNNALLGMAGGFGLALLMTGLDKLGNKTPNEEEAGSGKISRRTFLKIAGALAGTAAGLGAGSAGDSSKINEFRADMVNLQDTQTYLDMQNQVARLSDGTYDFITKEVSYLVKLRNLKMLLATYHHQAQLSEVGKDEEAAMILGLSHAFAGGLEYDSYDGALEDYKEEIKKLFEIWKTLNLNEDKDLSRELFSQRFAEYGVYDRFETASPEFTPDLIISDVQDFIYSLD